MKRQRIIATAISHTRRRITRVAAVPAKLTSDQVLVTVGTPCTLSAVGTTETTRALVAGDPSFILHAAFDAGLVDLSVEADGSLSARYVDGALVDTVALEAAHGRQLRAGLGIRVIDELVGEAVTDIAAPLPHDLGRGGLRRLAGLSYAEIRGSELRDMHGLFDDDPRLGPSLQSQLFAYAGIGAMAGLPRPLAEILDDPSLFRVVAGSSFPGLDSWAELRHPTQDHDGKRDKFAARLASSLASHGSALVSAMLSPSYPLSRTVKNPEMLDSLRSPSGYMRVPQSPSNTVAACASSLIAFSEAAPQMLFDYPGFRRPVVALWTAADAATMPGYHVLEGFGPNALMTSSKLETMNQGRAPADRRSVGNSLAPFDVDANGTVIGDGGSGVLVTTMDFALRNHLDITSIIVGWGHSGETGGKAHFAGVGFGGENAMIHAYDMAREGHGMGVTDFEYLVAHATGTSTNSKTDLTAAAAARSIAAERAGYINPLPKMRVGTPKALGDGHTMGETGLKAVSHAISYLLGQPSVSVPTLRNLDPNLGKAADQFNLIADSFIGNESGAAICATQGFGGYNGAVAFRAATAETLAEYRPDPHVLAGYLEQWPELRRDRELREFIARTQRGSTLSLAQHHCWPSLP
jgi:3-oxoacyl-[acyl-carrier-protein] synthase II